MYYRVQRFANLEWRVRQELGAIKNGFSMYKQDSSDTLIARWGNRSLVKFLMVLTAILAVLVGVFYLVILVHLAVEQRARAREQPVFAQLRIGVPGHHGLESFSPPQEP